jgi:drug/metabolite transporter (DMT)-like permease
MDKLKLTYLQLALGMIIFGSATPVSKLVTEQWPVLVASLGRMLVAGIVLAPLIFLDWKSIRKIGKTEITALALITIFGMVGFSVLLLYGMSMTTGTAASVIMAMTPAMTAIGAWLFFKERFTSAKFMALLLAFIGVLIVNVNQMGGESGNNVLLGGLLVFGAVCCQAVYTLAGKTASQKLRPVTVAAITSIAAAVLFVPVAAFQFGQFELGAIDTTGISALLWWGIGTLAIGTWLLYSGMKHASGFIGSAFTGLMPVSALILSYILLGDAFHWTHVVGFGLVVASIYLMARTQNAEQ